MTQRGLLLPHSRRPSPPPPASPLSLLPNPRPEPASLPRRRLRSPSRRRFRSPSRRRVVSSSPPSRCSAGGARSPPALTREVTALVSSGLLHHHPLTGAPRHSSSSSIAWLCLEVSPSARGASGWRPRVHAPPGRRRPKGVGSQGAEMQSSRAAGKKKKMKKILNDHGSDCVGEEAANQTIGDLQVLAKHLVGLVAALDMNLMFG